MDLKTSVLAWLSVMVIAGLVSRANHRARLRKMEPNQTFDPSPVKDKNELVKIRREYLKLYFAFIGSMLIPVPLIYVDQKSGLFSTHPVLFAVPIIMAGIFEHAYIWKKFKFEIPGKLVSIIALLFIIFCAILPIFILQSNSAVQMVALFNLLIYPPMVWADRIRRTEFERMYGGKPH